MKSCFFTKKSADIVEAVNGDYYQVYNKELDCRYWIDSEVTEALANDHKLNDLQNNFYLSETIKLNDQGFQPFWTFSHKKVELPNTKAVIREISENKQPEIDRTHSEEQILHLVAKKLKVKPNRFDYVGLSTRDHLSLGILDISEFATWIGYLIRANFLTAKKILKEIVDVIPEESFSSKIAPKLNGSELFGLTQKGWEKIAESYSKTETINVFVAMAFTDNEKNDLNGNTLLAITETLKELGWNAECVNQKEFNDGIMDKVISMIDDSVFLVADLTYQKTGVYFEAGYAKGRGLPVIFTVKATDLAEGKVHFDVSHLNLVKWYDEADLREKLRNRVKQTIGTSQTRKKR